MQDFGRELAREDFAEHVISADGCQHIKELCLPLRSSRKRMCFVMSHSRVHLCAEEPAASAERNCRDVINLLANGIHC